MVERLQVQSRSPFEIHHILTGLEKTPEVSVESELYLPEGEGPFGCVIALHGSRGWASHIIAAASQAGTCWRECIVTTKH